MSGHSDHRHECPAPGCVRRVPTLLFACSRHWYALPQELRGRLNRAWRAAPSEYLAVRAECVTWLEEHPS